MFLCLSLLLLRLLVVLPSANASPISRNTGEDILFQNRASVLYSPAQHNPEESYPLLLVLHGYIHQTHLDYFSLYLGINTYVQDMDHYLLEVYGTENPEKRVFWNAQDACCDFHDQNPNDVEYLSSLIQTLITERNIDSERIIVIGHSNGGFMAHRLACAWGDNLHSIINISGAAVMDFSECQLQKPPNVLNIHGTWDQIIAFNGGDLKGQEYPSALYSTEQWARLSGCTHHNQDRLSSFQVHLWNNIRTEEYSGCEKGNRVTLWAVQRHGHLPSFSLHHVLSRSLAWAALE